MKRHEFRNILLGAAGMSVLAGCMSRIGKTAGDAEMGEPYRCGRCGYLTRSKTDLAGERCPRCYSRKFERISEEEMENQLSQGGQEDEG